MRNGEYCYFHLRWRMTTVDLSHSAHHVTTEFVLPVLEDADSIQITLGQIMRMIVCRQVDTKSTALLLYALQIASANLRRTGFVPYNRHVTVDLFRVPERIIGDEAWSPSDFANVGNVGRAPSHANQPSPAAPSPAKESCVVATLPEPQPKAPAPAAPSAAKESCVVATLPGPQPEAPSPAEDTHVARTPSSARESPSSDGGRTPSRPKHAHVPRTPAPATQPAPASNVSSSSLPSATQQRELQKAERAMAGALKGDWRDVKTLFEFAGIYPAKDNSSATDP